MSPFNLFRGTYLFFYESVACDNAKAAYATVRLMYGLHERDRPAWSGYREHYFFSRGERKIWTACKMPVAMLRVLTTLIEAWHALKLASYFH